MNGTKPSVFIIAHAPDALLELCGVSLLERQLRILQRLGFREATIITNTPEAIRSAIEPPSWARSELRADVIDADEAIECSHALVLPGDLYCDARLLRALAEADVGGELIDTAPPPELRSLASKISGARLVRRAATRRDIDAAAVDPYIKSMRRNIRPVFFHAPPPELRAHAEAIILDTAQNGTLDIPGALQSPVEDFVMRWLWRTPITPNQITAVGLAVAFIATACFAAGWLWIGMIPALAIGVIDGLDGKQARVKIETTQGGEWEHVLDYVFENSWWAALAFWFWRSGQLPAAWLFFALIVVSDLIDRLAKRDAKLRTGILLDDLTPFDRFVRLIGARRDVFVWALAIALPFAAAAKTFALCAWWGAATAAVHVVRAAMVALQRPRSAARPARH